MGPDVTHFKLQTVYSSTCSVCCWWTVDEWWRRVRFIIRVS